MRMQGNAHCCLSQRDILRTSFSQTGYGACMDKLRKHIFLFLAGIFILACTPDTAEYLADDDILMRNLNLPTTPFNYANPPLPAHLQNSQTINIDNTPPHNPVTDWGATLGRVLFYDKNLSINRTISCASCHKQERGFDDPNQFSIGFEGGQTPRHSMGLINARWYANGHFFWDERAPTLEDQVLMPIEDSIEMGLTLAQMEARMKEQEYYPILFKRAFGSEEINPEKASLALAQFVRSIVSYRSKYDEGRAMVNSERDTFPNFTKSEMRGKFLFLEEGSEGMKCSACHGGESFTGSGLRSNGLDATTTDPGGGEHTGDPKQDGTFKTPSLKDIAHKAPYMHDGRFATLEEVVEHYASGVQPHPNLDQTLKDFDTGQPLRPDLSELDKQALLDFLLTLSDTALHTDEKYSDPFK
jgi:cytochrome c peroxidase